MRRLRNSLYAVCLALAAQASHAGLIDLTYQQWVSFPAVNVGDGAGGGRDNDYIALFPVLGTHSASVSQQAGPSSAAASTTVTGVEHSTDDSYLLEVFNTSTAFASVAAGAPDNAFATAVGRIFWMDLGFEISAPVIYTGSSALYRSEPGVTYDPFQSGSLLMPGRYGTPPVTSLGFDRAITGEVRAGQSSFDVAYSSIFFRFDAAPTAVPAPAVVPLMLSGLVGFALLRRRRRAT